MQFKINHLWNIRLTFPLFLINLLHSDVPSPCYPDAPRYPLENLVELERNATEPLISCPVFRCAVHRTKL